MSTGTGRSWSFRRASVLAAALVAMLVAVSAASAGKPLGIVPHSDAAAKAKARAASNSPIVRDAGSSTATVTNLSYHNGHVMLSNTVHAIYWSGGLSFPANYRTHIDQFLTDVAHDSGKDSNAYAAATQYTQKINSITSHVAYNSSFGGSIVDTTPFPSIDSQNCFLGSNPLETCVTDQDLEDRIAADAAANGWSAGPANLIAIMTPPQVGICIDGTPAPNGACSDNAFCAYHSWTLSGGGGPLGEGDIANEYIYAVEPYEADDPQGGCDVPTSSPPNGAPADVTIDTLSHEHNEAVTDPFGAGWWDSITGDENGDKCRTFDPAFDFGQWLDGNQNFNHLINGHKYVMQNEWSNSKQGCFQIGPPTIDPASTQSGSPGDTAHLVGTNFFNVSSVKFNGVSATDDSITDPTHLDATVPAGFTPGKISVTTGFGSATSSFNFTLPLVVTAASPSAGKVGTPVTISGSGLFGITGVKFTGLTGPVSASFSVSGGVIHTTVPSAAISGPITVFAGASSQPTDPFHVTPAVSSFSPGSGVVGTSLTVNGSGFDSTSHVTVNGFDAGPAVAVTANKLVLSSVPDGSTTGKIAVTTTEGGSSLASTSTFKVGPKIADEDVTPLQFVAGDPVDLPGHNLANVTVLKIGSVTVPFTHDAEAAHGISFTVPSNVVTGKVFVSSLTDGSWTTHAVLRVRPKITAMDADLCGCQTGFVGTHLTITGTTLTGTTVKFPAANGAQTVSASASVSNGGTTLKTTVPSGAASGPILLTSAGGFDNTGAFHVTPKIGSLSPSSGTVGTPVTISGSGFDAGTVVHFNGADAAGLVSATANKLVVLAPDHAKTATISVTTDSGAGSATSTAQFKVGPKISTDVSGIHQQVGQDVDVAGFNLDEVAAVKLGSLPITTFTHDEHSLHFTLPDNAVTGKLLVQATSGMTFTTSKTLGVRPTLDPLATTTGTTGTPLVLTGKTLGGSTVKFTDVHGNPTIGAGASISGGTLKVTVPTGAVTGPIVVTNPGGSVSTGTFTVIPKITGFSSSSGPTGATITVNGSGFDSTATLSIGSATGGTLALAPTSGTSVKLHVPNGADTGHLTVTTTSGAGATSAPSTGTFTVTMSILGYPDSGNPGDSVTITGKGFGTSPTVTIHGQPAALTADPHDATHVTVTVPATPGSGPITVQNGSTTVQSATSFTINAAPVASDSPQFAAAGPR